MKHWLALLAASTALAGCNSASPPEVAATPAETVAPEPEPAPAPKPTYGSFGFDSTGMDTTVLPGDNFYQYANGTWARNTQIPADKSNFGMFTVLDDLSKERTRTIIEESAKDPSSKIGNAYNSYLDTAAIDAKGLAAFKPWLDQVHGLKSKAGLAELYARADRMGISTPFAFYIGQDDKNPDRYVTGLAQSGLGMPDRDY
jgi:putative endopeptidase